MVSPLIFLFGRSGKRSVIGGVGSVEPDAPRLGVRAAGLTGSTEPICSQALAVRTKRKQVGGPSGRSFPRPVSGKGPATSPPLQGVGEERIPTVSVCGPVRGRPEDGVAGFLGHGIRRPGVDRDAPAPGRP